MPNHALRNAIEDFLAEAKPGVLAPATSGQQEPGPHLCAPSESGPSHLAPSERPAPAPPQPHDPPAYSSKAMLGTAAAKLGAAAAAAGKKAAAVAETHAPAVLSRVQQSLPRVAPLLPANPGARPLHLQHPPADRAHAASTPPLSSQVTPLVASHLRLCMPRCVDDALMIATWACAHHNCLALSAPDPEPCPHQRTRSTLPH